MITRACASRSRMRRTTSTPSISGMRRSSSVTSGRWRSYASIASTPLPASATTRRSGSWLMMLATPVRSSAWASTSSTRAGAAAMSACNVYLRRQRSGIPGQHYLRPVARRGDHGQRGADAVGALLHAGHAEAGRHRIARDAAAVVGDREAESHRLRGRGAHGDAARARVADGVVQGLLHDGDDLALDAVAAARQLVEQQIDLHGGRALAEIDEALERRGDVLPGADVGPERADGTPRLGQVRPRQVDRGVDAATHVR